MVIILVLTVGYSWCLQWATLGGYSVGAYSWLLLVITVGYSCFLQWAALGAYSGCVYSGYSIIIVVLLTVGYSW